MKRDKEKEVVIYQANILNTRGIVVKTEEGNEGIMELKNHYRRNSVYVTNIWYTILEHLKPAILKARQEIFNYENSWKSLILSVPLKNFRFNGEKDYRKIKRACRIILGTYFELEIETDEKMEQYLDNLFTGLKHTFMKIDGIVHFRMKFNPEMLNHILNLSKGYTKLNKAEAISLKTIYSKRIYELICQYSDTGGFTISIEKLRHILDLEEKYSRIYDLKKWILSPSIKDISAKTRFNVIYEMGKKTGSIKFIFNKVESVKTLLLNKPLEANKQNKFRRILISYVFNKFLEKNGDNTKLFEMIKTIQKRNFSNYDTLTKFVNRVEFWEKEVINKKREKRELYTLVPYALKEDYYVNVKSLVGMFRLKQVRKKEPNNSIKSIMNQMKLLLKS